MKHLTGAFGHPKSEHSHGVNRFACLAQSTCRKAPTMTESTEPTRDPTCRHRPGVQFNVFACARLADTRALQSLKLSWPYGEQRFGCLSLVASQWDRLLGGAVEEWLLYVQRLIGLYHGYGSNINHHGTTYFCHCFHLRGCQFGYLVLTHSHTTQ